MSIRFAFAALDPISQARVRIFSFKLLVLLQFSIVGAPLSFLAVRDDSVLCLLVWRLLGVMALLRREPVAGSSLNGWDELLVFFALKYLAQFLAAISG